MTEIRSFSQSGIVTQPGYTHDYVFDVSFNGHRATQILSYQMKLNDGITVVSLELSENEAVLRTLNTGTAIVTPDTITIYVAYEDEQDADK